MNSLLSSSQTACVCRLCSGSATSPLYTTKGYDLVLCRSCGFVQVINRPDDALLDRLYAELHLKHLAFRDEIAARRENQRRLEFVKTKVPAGANVLDAGCATGDFLIEAKDTYTVYGVDISAKAVEVATQRLPELRDRLTASRLENLQGTWPQFDAVCLWDVIEHLWDPVPVVQDLLKLVKPGGYLFMSTPDIGTPTARVMRQKWAFMIPPYHLCFFSRQSFTHLFGQRLPAETVAIKSLGKWTNLTFIFYKLNQMSKYLAPMWLVELLSRSRLGRLNIYVPTGDIVYLAVKKVD